MFDQQLRDDAGRDHLGLLAGDAVDADRAGHAGDRCGRQTALLEPMDELRTLALRADQAAEGEVAAAQDRLDDPQVERVLVGEDEEERAGRRMPHLGLDRIHRDPADPRRPGRAERRGRGELLVARVEPVDLDVERREGAGDRPADVAGPVQLQMEERRGFWPASERFGSERREGERHRAAAALPERGPEREVALLAFTSAAREQRSRRGDRLQLQVAAADRAHGLASGHQHARAALSRRRALRPHHLDDDRGPAFAQPGAGEIADRAVDHGALPACTPVSARRIASLVAGAVSGGSRRWPPAAEIASRIAKNTENGSSSGGSPVALLR